MMYNQLILTGLKKKADKSFCILATYKNRRHVKDKRYDLAYFLYSCQQMRDKLDPMANTDTEYFS